jgi:hypothetical protein
MIIGNFTDSDPAVQGGYLDRLIATAIQLPTQPSSPTLSLTIPEICCDCLGVFGGGSEDYQNDKSTFFYRRSQASDTITLKLKKDGTEVATITDNTYGTLYDFGTWTTDPQKNLLYQAKSLSYKSIVIIEQMERYHLHGHRMEGLEIVNLIILV